MTNNDPREKIRHRRRVRRNHTIGAILVFLIAGLFFQILRGYAYDFQRQQVIVNGLVVLDSSPAGAKISVDGEDEGDTTGKKLTLEEGQHTLALNNDGYRPWRRQVGVTASMVNNVDYVRLMRSNQVWQPLATDGRTVLGARMMDNDRLLVRYESGFVSHLDLTSEQLQVQPIDVLALLGTEEDPVTDYSIVDDIGDHILIRFVETDESVETIRYAVVNLAGSIVAYTFSTDKASLSSEPQFLSDQSRVVYRRDSGQLLSLNLTQPTPEPVVVSANSQLVAVDGDVVVALEPVIADSDSLEGEPTIASWRVNHYQRDGDDWRSKVIMNIDQPASQLDIGTNRRGQFMSMVYLDHVLVYEADGIANATLPLEPTATAALAAGSTISLSPANEFILITNSSDQAQASVMVLDDSTPRLIEPATQGAFGANWRWMDDSHLYFVSEVGVEVSEFDGNYQFGIAKAPDTTIVSIHADQDWNRLIRLVDQAGQLRIESHDNRPQ